MPFKNIIAKLKLLHSKLNGSTIEYDLTSYKQILSSVKSIELSMKGATDATLKEQAHKLLENGIYRDLPDSLIIEGFALVSEVFRRILNIEPFGEQIIGGAALCKGKLVEMQTGEGKTLTAVFPAFFNALSKKGVHVLTFNDYLAKRDALWMKPVYDFLGLSVGYIQEGMSAENRRKAYASDITYCTAKESGFDYLRDSMCYKESQVVHRPLNVAIIDEADSILIDEARIPLVIAGATDAKKDDLKTISNLVKSLLLHDQYEYDEYARNVFLTENGIHYLESSLFCGNLYNEENSALLHRIQNSLHAHYLLKLDKDYIVRNGKVEIVDEFTGRVADKRRWPDGLQEAIETKENCDTQSKGKILNSITLQHFLQLYPKAVSKIAHHFCQ
jgi:preprotein translocase subunit SecA